MTEQRDVSATPQEVDNPLTKSAVFLVLVVHDNDDADQAVRDTLGSIADLMKNVAFRDNTGGLACTVGIGSRGWKRIMRADPPKELHPFKEYKGDKHTAIATPGDLIFHIRANERDLCFELERQIMHNLRGSVDVADETLGFRYFDARDLLGFVDGTANPVGPDLPASTLVGDEDPTWAGGSYLVVQKYIHELVDWEDISTEEQETIIGRKKADNVELPDATEGQKSHKTLCTITDDEGEHDILRDNMPFGQPGVGEFGTYFIGYSRHLWVTEKMMERMYIGDPPGDYDRILDFSTPHTGSTFFIPPAAALEALG